MQLEFVGHASVVFRQDPVHLLCDPWLTGTAFDDGWALLSTPAFGADDFASVTHIWFSHEHPDHFNTRTLAMIPASVRARLTVLFHASSDRKVAHYCEKMGFGTVTELEAGTWLTLAPGFDIRCDTFEATDDSWLLVRTPTGTLLNLNDCQVSTSAQADALHAATGDVDVLLTQYSVSSWDGNADDEVRRLAGADAMLDRVVLQANRLRAKQVIPFASFVWFCNEENFYMNSAARPVSDAAAVVLARTQAQPVVLYPGDCWTVGTPLDSTRATERYAGDLASLPSRPLCTAQPVDLDLLRQAAGRFTVYLTRQRSKLRLYLGAVRQNAAHQRRMRPNARLNGWLAALAEIFRLRIRPARIWLSDHGLCLEYSLLHGLVQCTRDRQECDIEMSSAALYFAFRFLWGGETLQINGRFHEYYPEGRVPLFGYLGTACAMNRQDGAQARPL